MAQTNDFSANRVERVRAMIASGMSYADIGRAQGISRWSARNFALRHGIPGPRSVQRGSSAKARVCACGDHGFLGLSRGFVALFDPEDMALVSCFPWCAVRRGRNAYAKTEKGTTPRRSMHRLLTKAPSEAVVDHKNGDGLDNRKNNLRQCTHSQNSMNSRARVRRSTGFKGVFSARPGRYRASITIERRKEYLGTFTSPEEAARAYDAAAVRVHGEFARTNAMLGLLPSP